MLPETKPVIPLQGHIGMIILDGGMSRELQRIGAPLRQPEWSALALMVTPERVKQVHAEFAAAGADIITTNSYAVVPFHIGEERFRAEGLTLASLAGRLARQAADESNQGHAGRQTRVAGSLPPIFGSYRPDQFDPVRAGDYLGVLIAGFRSSVDLWLGETLSSLAEARAVVQSVKDDAKPVWISFTLKDEADAASDAPRLRSGETVAAAATWAAEAEIDAILFNCSRPEVMAPAVATTASIFRAANVAKAIGVYANAFEGHLIDEANVTLSDLRHDLDAASYCDWADRWVAAGATTIGGCCGIGVGHIHGLATHLRGTA